MDGINITPLQAKLTLDLAGFQASLQQAQALINSQSSGMAQAMTAWRTSAAAGMTQLRTQFQTGFLLLHTTCRAQWAQLQTWFAAALQSLVSSAYSGVPGMQQAGYALYDAMLLGMQSAFSQVQRFVQSSSEWIAKNSTGSADASDGVSYVPYDGYTPVQKSEKSSTVQKVGKFSGSVNISVSGGISERRLARRIRDELGKFLEE